MCNFVLWKIYVYSDAHRRTAVDRVTTTTQDSGNLIGNPLHS